MDDFALALGARWARLGCLVFCVAYRNPGLLAKVATTIDHISGGRFELGLGAGWHQPEYKAFGYPFDHLAGRFEEALQVIVPLLREGHVDFQGQYYSVSNCVLRPRGPSPPAKHRRGRPAPVARDAQPCWRPNATTTTSAAPVPIPSTDPHKP